MCGIAGIIRKDGGPVDEGRLRLITDLVTHRGPDGDGYYFAAGLGLGHRHLSIIDVGPRSKQPMSYRGRYWITYNGAIYNYVELRAELERRGAAFKTASDTEVILAAYSEWGVDCLSRFNGMWAFAIYDSEERTVFIARDRFGVKPLYYLDTGEQFAIGSEIKQLLALQPHVRANRKIVIDSLLTHFGGHTDETYFSGVNSFPAAHYMVYRLDTQSYSFHRYYELDGAERFRTLSFDDAVEAFRELFTDAVRIRLRADVKVGAALSGGLDSSAVSAVAAPMYGAAAGPRFITIHGKSTEQRSDESDYAQSCARRLSLDLFVVEPSVEDFKSTIDEVVYTQEEPFGGPSMFMGWHVFREARARERRVMLTGQGGDETLLGYDRYYAAILRDCSRADFLRQVWLQSRRSSLSPLQVLGYYAYFTNAGMRSRRLKARSYLKRHIKEAYKFDFVSRSAASYRNIADLQKLEIETVQLPRLLRYDDRNSMRHAIETRMPFLDYRLVELAVALPTDYKIRDGWRKYLLREAFADVLPEEITWQKTKIGFEAPDRTWLRAHDTEIKKEILASRLLDELTDRPRLIQNFAQLSAKEQWAYFNLATWERVYRVAG